MIKTTDLVKSGIISQTDAESLAERRIRTDEDLWKRVGDNLIVGLQEVNQETSVAVPRLMAILSAHSVRRAKEIDQWWPRHWLLITSVLTLIVFAFLFFRAIGFLGSIPPPIGLQQRIVVATRDLPSGQSLRPSDVYTALLVPASDYFTDTSQVIGLVMTQSVQERKPLRHADVLRQQVVATQDIEAGKVIPSSAISLTWTTYRPLAIMDLGEVVSRVALRPVKSGQAITSDILTPPAQYSVPVVSVAGGLPAFHVITEADLVTKTVPYNTPGVTPLGALVGRYTLQSIPQGVPISADRISTLALENADIAELQKRYVLTIPVRNSTVSSAITQAVHISLLQS